MSDSRPRLHCPIPSTNPPPRKSEGTDLLEGFGWQNEDSGGFFREWVEGWGVTRLNLPLRGDIARLHMGLNSSHEKHGSFLVS